MREFRSRRDREMEIEGYIQACADVIEIVSGTEKSFEFVQDFKLHLRNKINGLIMKERGK